MKAKGRAALHAYAFDSTALEWNFYCNCREIQITCNAASHDLKNITYSFCKCWKINCYKSNLFDILIFQVSFDQWSVKYIQLHSLCSSPLKRLLIHSFVCTYYLPYPYPFHVTNCNEWHLVVYFNNSIHQIYLSLYMIPLYHYNLHFFDCCFLKTIIRKIKFNEY